jgi:hypothetical protein
MRSARYEQSTETSLYFEGKRHLRRQREPELPQLVAQTGRVRIFQQTRSEHAMNTDRAGNDQPGRFIQRWRRRRCAHTER